MLLAMTAAVGSAVAPADAETMAPDLKPGAPTAFLPFLDAPPPGRPVTHTPKLRIAFPGGKAHRGTLDTGSTGVVVSASAIPNLDRLPQLGPGELTYSSSGRIEKGVWVVTPVTISGADGTSVTTRPMPVLAVQEIACGKTARQCTPRQAPKNIFMIGVGFARQHDFQKMGDQAHNPFLNIEGMGTPDEPGAMRRGYLLGTDGVRVGLDAASAAGFTFVKLKKSSIYPDWEAAPACISVGGRTPAACGTMLMDTGVTVMYLRVPKDQLAGGTASGAQNSPSLERGTSIAVSVPGTQSIGYSFKVDDVDNPLAPFNVVLVGKDRNAGSFVNTSVRFLNGFDYLYDADGGFVGFRPVPAR